MNYPIIWAMKNRDLIEVVKYKSQNKSVAHLSYAGMTGMLVAVVQMTKNQLDVGRLDNALDILNTALKERKEIDETIKRYNQRFDAQS
tara:strand:+ start:281 stop:544 length:264 start_codon:yes stop_codon:yes gene_type:complete